MGISVVHNLDVDDMPNYAVGTVFTWVEITGPRLPWDQTRVARYPVRCKCGKEWVTREASLRSGMVKSCGCYRNESNKRLFTTHGMTPKGGPRPSGYNTWANMIQRCHNPKNTGYSCYGARGIVVCDRWRNSFADFYADMGPKPADLSIERTDNDGNYEPGNCVWADKKQQSANRRATQFITVDGEQMSCRDAGRALGIASQRISQRVNETGCTHQEAYEFYRQKALGGPSGATG